MGLGLIERLKRLVNRLGLMMEHRMRLLVYCLGLVHGLRLLKERSGLLHRQQ